MRNILKQSLWLFLAQSFGRLVGFFYNIFLAQSLGVSGFGLFSVALAYFYILQSFAEFGFNRYLVRELAKDESKVGVLTYNVNLLRIIFSLLLVVGLGIFLQVFDSDKSRFNIILLTSLAIVPQAIAQTIDSIFVATKKLQFSAIASVLLSLSQALFGIYLTQQVNVAGASLALIIGQLAYLLCLYSLSKSQGFNLGSKINFSLIKEIVISSSGYGVLAIIGLISFRLDTVILSHLKGNFETGYYAAAYKFFETVAFIPSALAIAIFPVLAKLHLQSLGEVRKLFYKSFMTSVIFGISAGLLFYLVVPAVISYFLPKYLGSVDAVRVLSLAIPFVFVHIPANQVLLSTEKYLKELLVMYLVLITINCINYIILISQYGFMGAAWGTVISEFLTFVSFIGFLQFRVFSQYNK